MDFDAYAATLDGDTPPDGLSPALAALWHAAAGNWDQAHAIVQADGGGTAAWVHAYLHRVEGDGSNAAYWYRRAGRPAASGALKQEWEEIVRYLLG